jgi:DNA-binding MarR family transcriptional regulator
MHIRTANENLPNAPTRGDGGTLVELIHELSRCQRLLRTWLDERLRPWGLRDTDFWALWLCSRCAPSGVVQHELAAAAGVSEAQMSGLVERLRQNGLLIGCRGEADRRRQYWRLTAAGHELLTRIRAVLGESPTPPAMPFSRQDRGTLLELVQKLTHELTGDGMRGGTSRPAVVSPRSQEAADEPSHRRAS